MKAVENPRGLILRAVCLAGYSIGAMAVKRQYSPFSGVLRGVMGIGLVPEGR